MKGSKFLVAFVLSLLVTAGCGDSEGDRTKADLEARGEPEAPVACTDAVSCNDGDPCTLDDCRDGFCEHRTNLEEPGCQDLGLRVELATEPDLAPTESIIEVAFLVGTFQGMETVGVSYRGVAEARYLPAENRLRVEALSLAVDPVRAEIGLPTGVLSVRLDAFRLSLGEAEEFPLDPDGSFAGNTRLTMETLASIAWNGGSILENAPLVLLSDELTVSGRWVPKEDTDGDGLSEFDLLADGIVSYGFEARDVPLLGQVSASATSSVQLGFRGEETLATAGLDLDLAE